MPLVAKESFYITTPIYYVNGVPHLGHAYTMVATDSFARWHRMLGEDVFFLTGTDEHGLKVAQAAEENGRTPKEWVDLVSQGFVEAWETLGITYDDFIRTTEPRHYETVQLFLSKIYENGYIYEGSYRGLYCVACEAYYAESELIESRVCPVHLKPVTEMEEPNYFFALSKLQEPLLKWFEEYPDAVKPDSKRNEALGFIRGGLQDISITRTSIKWGVPVPWDSDHVFYVWYDALVNYLTAIDYGRDPKKFDKWWPVSHHILGKDILRFHCVWWPAMCLAAGITPPHALVVHGWLLLGGEKMSKSRGNNVDPLRLVEQIGLDPVRYYLMRDNTFGSDGDFTFEGLFSRYNSELANNYGNLLSRVVSVTLSKCGGISPKAPISSPLASIAQEAAKKAVSAWGEFAPQEALEATWELIRETNAYLERNEPWKMEVGPQVDEVLGSALEVLRIVSVLAYPAIPSSATEVWRRLGLEGTPGDEKVPEALHWGGYRGGFQLVKLPPLFPRLVLDDFENLGES